MSAPQISFDIQRSNETFTASQIVNPHVSFSSEQKKSGTTKNNFAKVGLGVIGMVLAVNSFGNPTVFANGNEQTFSISKNDLKNPEIQDYNFTKTESYNSTSSSLTVMNQTIQSDYEEELDSDTVERVYYSFKPEVTRRTKVVKKDKLNFRRSFENIREVY